MRELILLRVLRIGQTPNSPPYLTSLRRQQIQGRNKVKR